MEFRTVGRQSTTESLAASETRGPTRTPNIDKPETSLEPADLEAESAVLSEPPLATGASHTADATLCARCGYPAPIRTTSSGAGEHVCPECAWPTGQPYASGPERLGVLRNIHFRRVWTASFISNTGNWMEMLAVQMVVAHETGSLKMMGYLGAAQLTPILVFGLLGGLLADRVNRRSLLIVTQALLMLIAIALALLSAYGQTNATVLLVISAVQGTVMAFNTPAWQVLTPRLVPRAQLTKAITLNGIQFNASRVLGPALAGVLLSAFSPTVVFVVNAVTFSAVLFAFAGTPDSPAPPRDGSRAGQQIAQAASFIFRHRGPFCVLLATLLMSLLAAPLIRMLPLYVIDVYGLSDTQADRATGWFLTVQGLGAVLGGLALKFVPSWYPKHHFIPMAITGAGLTISLFALTTTLWTGFVAMFFVGIFWIWAFNQSWAALQNLVEDRMRGRVMSIAAVGAFGITALGNVIAGWLGETVGALSDNKALGTHLSVGALSAVLLGAGVVMLIWRVPEVDGMPRPTGPRSLNLLRALMASEHRPARPLAGASVLDDPRQTVDERDPS